MSIGRSLDAPSAAFLYDWNILPLDQQLWLKWLETLKEFPSMQAPESYNLTQLMDQIKAGSRHPSDHRNTIGRALLDPGARPSAPFRVSSH